MDIKLFQSQLNQNFGQIVQKRGKSSEIELYLSLLDTSLSLLTEGLTDKTLLIGFNGSLVNVSLADNPFGLTKWCEANKTEMNLIIGPWLFNPDNNVFEPSEQSCFFLESWHGYLIGETHPFLIIDDSFRYPRRKSA